MICCCFAKRPFDTLSLARSYSENHHYRLHIIEIIENIANQTEYPNQNPKQKPPTQNPHRTSNFKAAPKTQAQGQRLAARNPVKTKRSNTPFSTLVRELPFNYSTLNTAFQFPSEPNIRTKPKTFQTPSPKPRKKEHPKPQNLRHSDLPTLFFCRGCSPGSTCLWISSAFSGKMASMASRTCRENTKNQRGTKGLGFDGELGSCDDFWGDICHVFHRFISVKARRHEWTKHPSCRLLKVRRWFLLPRI